MKKNSDKHRKDNKPPAISYIYKLLSVCSFKCLFRLARVMAFVVQRTNNQISRQTRQNIELCFPEFNKKQQDELITESIVHTCCAFLELAALWNKPVDKLLKNIKSSNIDDQFTNDKAAKIIVVPHHGSWELMIYWLAQRGNFYTLYKPARKKIIDQYIFDKRSRNGATMVPTNTIGLRTLLKGLKKQATCMILPDQRPGKNTAQVENQFFGHEVATSLLVKNLSTKVASNIYLAAITRDLKEGCYHLSLESMDNQFINDDDETSAQYLNERIQNLACKNLCQYQWSYRRFNEDTYR